MRLRRLAISVYHEDQTQEIRHSLGTVSPLTMRLLDLMSAPLRGGPVECFAVVDAVVKGTDDFFHGHFGRGRINHLTVSETQNGS